MARPLSKTSPSPSESFGVRLARLRKERGFTQVELAEKSGMIQALVSDYERDKLRPYADVVVRLALALDVSTDELLGLARPKKRDGAEAHAFHAGFRGMGGGMDLLRSFPLRDRVDGCIDYPD